MGGIYKKKSSVSECHKRFNESSHVEMLKILFDINGTVPSEFIPQGKTVNVAYYVEILKRYVNLFIEKGLKFGSTIEFSTMTMLQLTKCSLLCSLRPKTILKWNIHPIPLIWLRMSSVPKKKKM
jgi:hypothetical protein